MGNPKLYGQYQGDRHFIEVTPENEDKIFLKTKNKMSHLTPKKKKRKK